MQRKERIAVYGGTFDPVHFGHLTVAKKTIELFDITRLLFVPARHAPHKLEREVTSSLHRHAMLVLATQDEPRMFVSTFELEDQTRRYTINTLEHFKHQFSDAELFFVMGADSWAEIETWREWNRLTEMANLIVVTRPGCEVELDQHNSAIQTLDIRGWEPSRVSQAVNARTGPRVVYFSDVAMVDVSATKIREAVRTNDFENLNRLVPAAVADYIIKYELYRNGYEA
jgi:nicotinate-nucleotide adenylyltransferase